MQRTIPCLFLTLLLASRSLVAAEQAEPIRHSLRTIDAHAGSWALSRDGRTLAELTTDGSSPAVRLSSWEGGSWTERATITAKLPGAGEIRVRSLVLSDDGRDVYLLCRADKGSRVWLLHNAAGETGFEVQSHDGLPAAVRLVAGQGSWLLAHDAEKNATGQTVFLFDLGKKTVHPVELSEMPNLANLSAGFSPTGDRLALLFRGWGRSFGYVVDLSGGEPGKGLELDLRGLGFAQSAPPPRFTAGDRFGVVVENAILTYDVSGKLVSATPWKPAFGTAVEGKLSGDGRRAVVRVDPPFGEDYLALLDAVEPVRILAEYECRSLGNVAVPSEGPTGVMEADLGANGDAIVAWPATGAASNPISSSIRAFANAAAAGLAFFVVAVAGWAYFLATRSRRSGPRSDTCGACGFPLTARGRDVGACGACGAAWLSGERWLERRDVVVRLWGGAAGATLAVALVVAYLVLAEVPASASWPRDLLWHLVAGALGALALALAVGHLIASRQPTPNASSLEIRKVWAADSAARVAALVVGDDEGLVLPALKRLHGESPKAWVDAALALDGNRTARNRALGMLAEEIRDRDLLLRLLDAAPAEDRASAILKKLALQTAELFGLAAGENEIVALAAAKRLQDPAAMERLAEGAATANVRTLAKGNLEKARKAAERREAERQAAESRREDEARRKAEDAKAGTTPGVIFFSLDGTLPDQSAATTQITMFAMRSGNAHLMMDGIPKMLGSLPSVPDSDDVVAQAYRRMAERLHWKRIDPTVQAIFKAGVPVFAIAFPQPEDFG